MKSPLFFVVGLLVAAPAIAQTGTLEGTIRSAGGDPLPGATVQVTDTPLGTTTDTGGRYRLADVPAGLQTVEARFVGYAAVRRLVSVEAGRTATLDVTLSEAALGLDQVVVSADRRAQPLRDTPAAITAIPQREVERRANVFAGEMLVGVPGVRVSQGDYFNTITIRGVPNRHGNDTFVALVDGVPFVTGNDEVDVNLLAPPQFVDRVEVLRGPTSSLYGRGGVSGAIQYFTPDPFGQPLVRGSVTGGSFGLAQAQVTAAATLVPERNALLVSGLYQRRDGWRDRTDREAASLLLKNQWLVSEATSVTVTASASDVSQGTAIGIPLLADGSFVPLAGGLEANYDIDGAEETNRLFYATARAETRLAPGVEGALTLHARDVAHTYFGGFQEPFDPEAGTVNMNGFFGDNTSQAFYAEPQVRARLGERLSLTAGASYERQSGESTEDWTGEYGFNPATFEFLFYIQKRHLETGAFTNQDAWVTDRLADITFDADIYGAYAQADVGLIPDRLTLGLGGRFDGFRREAYYGEVTTQDGTTPDATTSDRASAFSPKVSLTFWATPRLTAYGTVARGFSPAFGPVWAFRDRETTLEPETATNAEVGVKGSALGERLAFGVALFRLDRQDLLLLVPTEGQSPLPQNAGRQLSQGVEVEVRGDAGALVPGLSGFATYSYTEAEWIDYRFGAEFGDTVYDFSGNRVAGAPRHLGSAGLTQRVPRWGFEVGAWADVSGDYFFDNGNTVEGGANALVNLTAGYAPRVLRGAELRLNVYNLFDTTTYNFFGGSEGPTSAYPGRPREVVATLRYTL